MTAPTACQAQALDAIAPIDLSARLLGAPSCPETQVRGAACALPFADRRSPGSATRVPKPSDEFSGLAFGLHGPPISC